MMEKMHLAAWRTIWGIHILSHNTIITDLPTMTETITGSLSSNSLSANCSPVFLHHKNQEENSTLDFTSPNTGNYNLPFKISELQTALNIVLAPMAFTMNSFDIFPSRPCLNLFKYI